MAQDDGKIKIGTELDDSGLEKGLAKAGSKLGRGFGKIAKVTAAGVTAAAAGVGALVKSAVDAYARYEQLVGGVDTLYKESSGLLQQYAADAYKTAGMSANQYMEQATSFSSALIQGLDGDTKRAAESTDVIMRDISDNANKLGTNVESVQYAYQGFAKQNYTMLDNLKLGYGGTRGEMERLLADAEKLSGKKYDISNFADVSEAIHVIQVDMGIAGYSIDELNDKLKNCALSEEELSKVAKDMGISNEEAAKRMKDGTLDALDAQVLLGTTAKEAATTIEGSAKMMKASWENLLVGIADENADFGKLIDQFVESAGYAFENIIPRVEQALVGVGDLVSKLIPILMEKLPSLIKNVAPKLIGAGYDMILAINDGLIQALPAIFEVVAQLLTLMIEKLGEGIPMLLESFTNALPEIVAAITNALPQIIDAIIKAVPMIITAMAEAFPQFITAAGDLILALADGLIKAIPELMKAIPQILTAVINGLVSGAGSILQVGKKFIGWLWSGVTSAIGGFFIKVVEFAKKIPGKISDGLSTVGEIGKDLIRGLWNGIKDMAAWIYSKIEGFGKNVLKKLKNFFGIESPSKLMRDEVGIYLAQGVVKGFEMDDPIKEIEASLSNSMASLNLGINSQLAANVEGVSASGLAPVMNFYDTQTSADAIYRRFNKTMTYGLARQV